MDVLCGHQDPNSLLFCSKAANHKGPHNHTRIDAKPVGPEAERRQESLRRKGDIRARVLERNLSPAQRKYAPTDNLGEFVVELPEDEGPNPSLETLLKSDQTIIQRGEREKKRIRDYVRDVYPHRPEESRADAARREGYLMRKAQERVDRDTTRELKKPFFFREIGFEELFKKGDGPNNERPEAQRRHQKSLDFLQKDSDRNN